MEWKNINKDDTILIQSNTTWTLRKYKCSVKDILESFLAQANTVVLPTFNTDFGDKGTPFNINTTPSHMGMLTEEARKYPGAVRSGHPMYSFVAIGEKADLFNVNNFSGYGKDSPFAILHKLKAKIGVLGLPDNRGNTFYHHIEEMNRVPYRFYKKFTGYYTDKYDNTELRTYAFYCRILKNTTYLNPVGDMMWERGLIKGDKPFEGTGLRVIETDVMYDFVTRLIKTGRAEGLLYRRGKW